MARSRNKIYQQGDRINIYLSRDLTPEFVEWINKQSDLSNFFLYAAQQLYQQTGFVDVSEVMPRKINFDLSSTDTPHSPIEKTKKELSNKKIPEEMTEEEKGKDSVWSSIEDLDDDPFA
ncbi:MAG: hypothetical protein ACQEWF_22210 [Bacillota bacterium]